MRKIGDAFSATTASLWNSLRIIRYGSSSDGALLFWNQARHWLTQPTTSGASSSAIASCSNCERKPVSVIAGSPDKEKQRQQRAEAVGQVHGDPALLDQADQPRQCFGAARDRQVEPVPEVVAERHLVRRFRVERRRQNALDAEERLEHLPDRLPEALGGILHTRRLQREAAIPCGPLAQASMILAVHDLDRQQHDGDDDQQEDD